MAATYPAGIVSLSNPTSGDDLSDEVGGLTHSEQHGAVNDEIEAVETELGTTPSGDYATVKARLDAIQGRVFDAVAYGALVDGSTDDTSAWQDAIDAAEAAGGGVVTSSKAGISIIGGALQDTGGANAQLILPSIHVTSGEQITVVLRGINPPPADISVIGSMTLPESHLVLESTLSSGTGAVIGCKGPSGSAGGFSNLHADIRDLAVRTVSNPTISALDLRYAATANVEEVVVDCGTYDVSAVTEPTSTGSFAVRLPTNNNGARTTVRNVSVIGFYNGYEHAEHAVFDNVSAWGCKIGSVPTVTNHASIYQRFMVIHCERGIKPTGAHALDILQMDIEHAPSGWRTTDYDIDDASNYLTGTVHWWSVLGGTGPHNSFTVNSAAGMNAYRVGTAAGGGGTTTYWRRDRMVATGGETILTLGATPVASSPLVWVNNTIKWPGTDYTISSNVITFGSALTASDVVLVSYETTNASPSAAALSSAAVNILDNFNRADNNSTMGTTSTGSKTWTAESGTWGIVSNMGRLFSGGPAARIATVDAGVADCTVSVKINQQGTSNAYYGLMLRSTGSASGYLVQINGASNILNIQRLDSGTGTNIGGSPVAYTPSMGDTITAVLLGNSITVKVNGSTVFSATDSTYPSQTKHGLWSYANDIVRFDDFSIQP